MKFMRVRKQLIFIVLGAFVSGGIIGWALTSNEPKAEGSIEHDHSGESIYTCSMHPQIKQEEPGSCPICGMDLVPLSTLSDSDSADPYVMTMSPEAVALANIATSTLKTGGAAGGGLSLSGAIEADERKVTTVSANFGGRVDALFVAFTGQEVKQGQRLARIYSPDLITAHRELVEAKKAKEISPKLYEAAKQKLKQWQLTDAQISKMEQEVDYQPHFDIYATTAGVVTERKVASGDYVSRGQVLFEITNLSKVWVMLDAYEHNVSQVDTGDEIRFTVNALPSEEFTAKVTFVDPVISQDSRSAKVRAEVRNVTGKLKPGMFVTATVKADREEKTGMFVPRSSILWTGKRSVVYRQVGDEEKPAFEMVEVVLGSTVGDMQEVLSGLSEGDRVVSNGVFAVDGAAQLSGKYSMMSHPEQQQVEVSSHFGGVIDEVVAAYLEIKNQLVEDQSAKGPAGDLFRQLKAAKTALQGSALETWEESRRSLMDVSSAINQTADIQEQRDLFMRLSNDMINLLDVFGAPGKLLYKDYCPMAQSDQGAYWLSEFKEIKNPYFGASMLSCGEVKRKYE
ncbi:efflux RND transporter periplasmic adaptor subunit [Echinicola strongylocentroti]|uniref:Efflux RND transporter periplasmic adaptor subunit n=1 Tax=Echinicola strongylocentroti TaxID=1795355 RepID=A0A2Z4IMG1_9BACT|nr:efflux RND transporter periplasmic adaptor subunit [Echinicola strongylocentroti]AWW31907.1 efflux RND transporter periplasmic adaptor subunit [Echinicola strongylocentroti]